MKCPVHRPRHHRHYRHPDQVCWLHQCNHGGSWDDKDDISAQSRHMWRWDIQLHSAHHLENVDMRHTHHCPVKACINGYYYYNYNRFTTLLSGTTQVSRYQKARPFSILLKQRWWGGSGISWTICKLSALCSRQITTPAPHQTDFYGPDALHDTQPTASKHWRLNVSTWCLLWHVSVCVSTSSQSSIKTAQWTGLSWFLARRLPSTYTML